MILEITLVIAMIGVLFLCARFLDGRFFSGWTDEQIEELGRGLKKIGYKRMEDVDGFAYFENVYRFNPDFTPLRRVFEEARG